MKTNESQLVMLSLQGNISHPSTKGYYVGYDGQGRILPGTGGITYNYKIGDPCMNLVGDHVEPGVSIKNMDDKQNNALQNFSCIANSVRILNGPAKGAIGYITGTHGGVEHAFVYFDANVLEQLDGSETMLIKGYGQGLKLLDFPNITIMNIDPSLFKQLVTIKQNKLHIAVTHVIPSFLMGSGLGSTSMQSGDYDIMTQDKDSNQIYNLDSLRFGDIIAIEDHYAAFGPHYQKGAYTIGVVVHSDSFSSGHGPGVSVILTTKEDDIDIEISDKANLLHYNPFHSL